MVRKRVYPDTNVALHYRRPNQIDWLTLVAADSVVLVLTPVFVAEIDAKKNGGSRLLKQRAREFTSWMRTLLSPSAAEIRPGVVVEFQAHEPELSIDFDAERLSRGSEDDRQIACILAGRNVHPDDEHVCVTTDTSMIIKASARRIAYVQPAEDDVLPLEADDIQKENDALKKQLALHVNATSDLRLGFGSGGNRAAITVSVPALSEDSVKAFLAKEELRYRTETEAVKSQMARSLPLNARRLKTRSEYIDEWETWIKDYRRIALQNALVFYLPFELTNPGRAPGTNIKVDLRLPDHVRVRRRPWAREFQRRPRIDMTMSVDEIQRILEDARPVRASEMEPPEDPEPEVIYDEDDRHVVRIEHAVLNHHEKVKLPLVAFNFVGEDAIASFAVKYTILSASQPLPTSEELHVVVQKGTDRIGLPDMDA